MLTSLELKFDVISELLGICVQKKDPAPKSGETLQIYIPSLMPNITKSIPTKKNKVTNKGAKLFLNDSSCKPSSNSIITTQNYLTGKLARNCIWQRSENSRIKSRELVNSIDQGQLKVRYEAFCPVDGNPVDIKFIEDYNEYYTIGNERITCYAPNGKFSELLFNDNKYTK